MEQQLTFFLALAVGLIFGGLSVWLMLKTESSGVYKRAKVEVAAEMSTLTERLSGKDVQIASLSEEKDEIKKELDKQRRESRELVKAKAEVEARLVETKKSAEEKLAVVERAQKKLSESFRALSAEALKTNNQAFLDLAKTTLEKYQEGARTDLESRQKAIDEVVKPLRESLGRVDENIRQIEKDRAAAYAGITEQVKSLYEVQTVLRSETSNLVNALRTPSVRGRWGEMQLRRVVEMAGMVSHCDFDEQVGVDTDDGRLRPDLIVHLPNDRSVIVDAKVSLKAYLEALDATGEDARRDKLTEHASQVRSHLHRLGAKAYWGQFPSTPEFVVAFLPGEAFFSAALEADPSLIEYGIDQKVILATPTTLIALLKSVAYGWKQETLARNAHQVSELGKALYERLSTFTQHLAGVGAGLRRTVNNYNHAVGSLESRVLVSARRFCDLGTSSDKELVPLDPVDTFPRSLQAVDWGVTGGTVKEPEEAEDLFADQLPAGEPELPDEPRIPDEPVAEAPDEPEECRESEVAAAVGAEELDEAGQAVPEEAPETPEGERETVDEPASEVTPAEPKPVSAATEATGTGGNRRTSMNYLSFVKAM